MTRSSPPAPGMGEGGTTYAYPPTSLLRTIHKAHTLYRKMMTTSSYTVLQRRKRLLHTCHVPQQQRLQRGGRTPQFHHSRLPFLRLQLLPQLHTQPRERRQLLIIAHDSMGEHECECACSCERDCQCVRICAYVHACAYVYRGHTGGFIDACRSQYTCGL